MLDDVRVAINNQRTCVLYDVTSEVKIARPHPGSAMRSNTRRPMLTAVPVTCDDGTDAGLPAARGRTLLHFSAQRKHFL